MPLSLGLRDEENERINNILNKLMELVYVPGGMSTPHAEQLLAQMGLSVESIAEMSNDDLNSHVVKFHFDFANMEKLADMLATIPSFKEKAVSLYNFIQTESRMFSFDIFNKINNLNK
ncbi:hypothetical protein HYN59_05040 [Flavobacterium album]|uniref:Uncharacterized protein n=1 Tax=Flavobacterium album TaxID=2175091 RepID=A0A2S1QVS9_9FLAO|nr:hypothetical protein [Flavobacterium album]AWH84522.1 hypothetical protein HYN59_05040 [Flavobacterium album]